MRILSHLNIKEYPFYIPRCFLNAFNIEVVSLNYDPFSDQNEKKIISLQGMKSSVAYTLLDPLEHTYIIKSFHSNAVVQASASIPNADGQYVVAPFSKLATIFNEKRQIGIQTADCLAVIFCFENDCHFLGGISHAGWRGYSTGILQNMLKEIKRESLLLGITEKELLSALKVHIAPAIFGVTYETGNETSEALLLHRKQLFLNFPSMTHYYDLYNEVMNVRKDGKLTNVVDEFLLKSQQSLNSSEKIFPDLQLLAALECVIMGIPSENIEILRENTYTHPSLFSFRRAFHKKTNQSLRQWTHLCFPVIG